jgi:uncharacterized membrane protein YjfL (UPF0719 family)
MERGAKLIEQIAASALTSVIFAFLGFMLLFAGYRVFDILTPGDLGHKIFVEGRIAPAMFAAAFCLALAIIVSRAIR